MDDLDLSNLLGFDLTSKDDCMQIFLVAIFFYFWWPRSTGIFTFLCLAQMHFGIVPKPALTWILAMQLAIHLGKLSETLASYCGRNTLKACNYTFKFLLVRPGLFVFWESLICCVHFYRYAFRFRRFFNRAIARLVAALARALAAFIGSLVHPVALVSDFGVFN
jgi:hypothetical protein